MSDRRLTARALWREVHRAAPDWAHVAQMLILGVNPGDNDQGHSLWSHLTRRDLPHVLTLMERLRFQDSSGHRYDDARTALFHALIRPSLETPRMLDWTDALLDQDPRLDLVNPRQPTATDQPSCKPLLHLVLLLQWRDTAVADPWALIERLLDRGARVEHAGDEPRSGWNLAFGNDEATVRRLLDHPTVDRHHRSPSGQSLLHLAASGAHPRALQRLIGEGLALDREDADGLSALHTAVSLRRLDEAGWLLEAGADPNQVPGGAGGGVPGGEGITPLHRAVMMGDPALPMVNLLLAYGADRSRRNASGFTPFEVVLGPAPPGPGPAASTAVRQRLEDLALRDLWQDQLIAPAGPRPARRL